MSAASATKARVTELAALDRDLADLLEAQSALALQDLDARLTGVLKATNDPDAPDTEATERHLRRSIRRAAIDFYIDTLVDEAKWGAIDALLGGGVNSEFLYGTVRNLSSLSGHARRNLKRELKAALSAVPGIDLWVDAAEEAWNAGFLRGYNTGGGWAARLISHEQVNFSLYDESVLQAIRDRAKTRAALLGDELADGTADWLMREMFLNGEGPAYVRDQFRRRGFTEIVGWRIDRIARTESLIAVEMGAYDTFVRNGVEYVEWQTHLDDKTRPSHEALDGQQVKTGSRFANGLRFPGDPDGPPGEIINCRCTLAPVNPDRVDRDKLWTGGDLDGLSGNVVEAGVVDDLRQRTMREGGATYNPRTGQYMSTGYAVALVDGTYREVDREDRAGFEEAVGDLTRAFPEAYVGTWLDGSTIHVDPSTIHRSLERALQEARRRGQLAIFNLDSGEEIRLDRAA